MICFESHTKPATKFYSNINLNSKFSWFIIIINKELTGFWTIFLLMLKINIHTTFRPFKDFFKYSINYNINRR